MERSIPSLMGAGVRSDLLVPTDSLRVWVRGTTWCKPARILPS
jgi:hypothetical protein